MNLQINSLDLMQNKLVIKILSATTVLIITPGVLWLLKYSYSVYKSIKKYANIPGTEPKGIKGFFLGIIPKLVEEDKKGVSFSHYLQSLIDAYGKTFKYRFFNKTSIFTIEPELVKEILIDENFPKPVKDYHFVGFPGGERFPRFLGRGLVTEIDHAKWKDQRSLYNPGFHRQSLMRFMHEFNAKSDILIDFLKKRADGKTQIKLLDQFNHTALDIIASVAFSMEIDSINDPTNKFNAYIFEALSGLKYFFQDPFIKFKPHKWPFIWKYRRAVRYLRKTGLEQILSRLEMIKKNEELPNDILTTILKSHEEREFDLQSMADDFVTFFVAGQETTATLLTSLFLELGRNENVLEKLKNEIDTAIGTKSEISFEDLHKLKYTSCCIKEALRLWPPASQISRVCKKDINIGNIKIPKDTRITVGIYASGRCEEFFKDALVFKPERFMKTDDTNTYNGALSYIHYPFSLGPRNCIGQNFAQIEAKVIIAKFIQNFNFKLDMNQSFDALQAGTLRPKDGTKVYLTLRHH